MSDLLLAIKEFLSMAWHFLMNTYIPGTEIAFGVFFVGFAVIDIGFRFLSLALGYDIGAIPHQAPPFYPEYIEPRSVIYGEPPRRIHISDGRKNDVR